ncbi:MAG: flagellar biosynthetic protein FliR [Polyangiaceae bacterium]|nr:flagellar biosynthetic protein FliR [Polyangiaceae bacterium]
MDHPVVQALAAIRELWPDLERWIVVWARVAPAVFLVPAFGLRAVVLPVRLALGLAMALAAGPAAGLVTMPGELTPWRLLLEAARGLPVGLTAAAALHAATMAGGLIDTMRADRAVSSMPSLPEGSSPLASLLGILVAVAYLEAGGAASLTQLAVSATEPHVSAFMGAALALRGGVSIAVAAAMPLVVVSVVAEVAFALATRSTDPAHLTGLLAPGRSLLLLGTTAIVLDRLVGLLALVAQSGTR